MVLIFYISLNTLASPMRWTWVWVVPKDGNGQGSLVYRSPWGCKESDRTEWLNWTELNWILAAGILISVLQRKDTEAQGGWRKLSWLSRGDWEAQITGKVLPFILSTWESVSGNHSLLHTPHRRRTWYSGQSLVCSLVLIRMVRSLWSRGMFQQVGWRTISEVWTFIESKMNTFWYFKSPA